MCRWFSKASDSPRVFMREWCPQLVPVSHGFEPLLKSQQSTRTGRSPQATLDKPSIDTSPLRSGFHSSRNSGAEPGDSPWVGTRVLLWIYLLNATSSMSQAKLARLPYEGDSSMSVVKSRKVFCAKSTTSPPCFCTMHARSLGGTICVDAFVYQSGGLLLCLVKPVAV